MMVFRRYTPQEGGKRLSKVLINNKEELELELYGSIYESAIMNILLNNKSSRLIWYTPREIPFEGEEQIKIRNIINRYYVTTWGIKLSSVTEDN